MERVCFTFEIREGVASEYKRRHDEMAQVLKDVIQEAGLSNYSLFRRGTQIVAYAEARPNVETAFARLATSELGVKWNEWFEELIVNLTDSQGLPMSFTEVWHLD